jgi:hypothetical protein
MTTDTEPSISLTINTSSGVREITRSGNVLSIPLRTAPQTHYALLLLALEHARLLTICLVAQMTLSSITAAMNAIRPPGPSVNPPAI